MDDFGRPPTNTQKAFTFNAIADEDTTQVRARPPRAHPDVARSCAFLPLVLQSCAMIILGEMTACAGGVLRCVGDAAASAQGS